MAKKKAKNTKKPTRKKGQSAQSKSGKPKGKAGSGKGKQPQKKRRKGAGFASNIFNRIRSLVWRTHKGEYEGKDYNDKNGEFLRVVREIYNDCKALGADCTDEIILLKYDEIKSDEKRPEPFIADDLYLETHPFWEIKDIEFQIFAPYLWVVSPMIIPSPHEFRVTSYYTADGDTTKGYNKYFKEWVDWCNMVYRSQFGAEFGSEEIEIHFIFTKPTYNEEKKRWETEILIVTPSGDIDSFGFTPQGTVADHEPTEFERPDMPEKPVKPSEKPPTEDVIKAAEVEEIRKTGELERLEIAKRGVMEEIKLYKEIDDKKELALAKKRLKLYNKRISRLL